MFAQDIIPLPNEMKTTGEFFTLDAKYFSSISRRIKETSELQIPGICQRQQQHQTHRRKASQNGTSSCNVLLGRLGCCGRVGVVGVWNAWQEELLPYDSAKNKTAKRVLIVITVDWACTIMVALTVQNTISMSNKMR